MHISYHNYWWVGIYIALCVALIVIARVTIAPVSYGASAGQHAAPAAQPATPHAESEGMSQPTHEPQTMRLLFFGDIMLDRNVKALMNANGGVGYVFENWRLPAFWEDADMMMANMEGAVTTDGAHYPPAAGIDFAFDEADAAQLQYYGFDTFTLANNHMLDQGRAGFLETQEHLTAHGYRFTGCPDRQVGECSVATTTLQGVEIGLAGYSMVYGLLDEDAMAEQIAALASSTDFVIANVHWGVEYVHQHNATQERVAHALVDAGADLVIGHHPHVVQDMEVYSPRLRSGEAGNGVPIFYSLGNFIFDQYFSTETQEGLGVGVVLLRDEGGVVIDRIDPLPYKSVRSQIELLTGEEREEWVEWFAEL